MDIYQKKKRQGNNTTVQKSIASAKATSKNTETKGVLLHHHCSKQFEG